MDTRTGQIITREELQQLAEQEREHFIEMKTAPTPKQAKERKVGRNDPCPCGSGKKFKRCHFEGGTYLRRKANQLWAHRKLRDPKSTG